MNSSSKRADFIGRIISQNGTMLEESCKIVL
jgi:hypothetical protein